jgi:uncharacterized RDD family membrane protein YckC
VPDRRLPGERLAGEIATAVLRNIDPDEIVRNLDVDAIAQQIDVDRLLERIDVDALVGRLDLDALVARIDLDALIERLDVDRIVDRLDIDAIARRVPVGDLVSTAEIQEAVDNVDLGPALRRAGLADIVAQSVGRSTLDTVRRRVVVLDALVERTSGKLLRQDVDSWPAGPRELVGDETGPLGELDGVHDGTAGFNLAGHYVGPFGRVLATAADVAGAVSSWTLLTTFVLSLLGRGFGFDVQLDESVGGLPFAIGLVLWIGTWFLLPLEVFGRTPAMGLLGMRVVASDGDVPSFRRILLRSLAQAPSVLVGGVGYLWLFVDQHRRALHDRAAGTVVVWDWGDREATISSPMSRWVAGDGDPPRQDQPAPTA